MPARAAADYYISHAAAADGIPYWDTGAPGLAALGDWGARAADPFNDHEPVDSSAAAIASQGLLRLARVLTARGEDGAAYEQAGLRTLDTLLNPAHAYLATDPAHEGLLLHSVYHWPNRWDHVPAGARTPRGESSQWGDYHAREAALYVRRLARGEPYLAFFGHRGRPGRFGPGPTLNRIRQLRHRPAPHCGGGDTRSARPAYTGAAAASGRCSTGPPPGARVSGSA